MTLLQLLAAVAVTGLLSAALTPALLRWLPESAEGVSRAVDPVDDEVEPDYRRLAQPRFVLACALCSTVAAAVSWTMLPLALQPMWTVLALAGVLLAAVDAATTWLPLSLTQATWAAMAVGTFVAASIAQSWPLLLRAGTGAAVLMGVYYLVHRVSRGSVAFGDVRFAPLLGAAAGADSWALLYFCLLAGSVLGGLQGAVQLLRGRPGGFPYTPAMLAGCYLGVVVLALLR